MGNKTKHIPVDLYKKKIILPNLYCFEFKMYCIMQCN